MDEKYDFTLPGVFPL